MTRFLHHTLKCIPRFNFHVYLWFTIVSIWRHEKSFNSHKVVHNILHIHQSKLNPIQLLYNFNLGFDVKYG